MKLCRRLLLCLPLLHGASATAVDGDWYVGAGGGVSRLTPDTDGSPFTLEESTSAAVGAFGGREFGRRYAVELGATRLGEAGLSDDQSVDYTVISGGVLGYVLGDLPRVRRGEAAGGLPEARSRGDRQRERPCRSSKRTTSRSGPASAPTCRSGASGA